MNKVIYSIIFFFLVTLTIQAQSLYIVGDTLSSKKMDLSEDWTIEFHSTIGNNGFSPILVKVKVNVNYIEQGHSFDVCWNGNCFPPTTTNWEKGDAYELAGGSQMPENYFYCHYYCQNQGSDPKPGKGDLNYVFYNVNNPNDSATIHVLYTFTNGGSVSEFYSDPSLRINHTLDNVLMISSDNTENYSLNIFDVNGTTITSINFSSQLVRNMDDLAHGVYLFTVSNSSGKILSKGKLLTEK